MYLGEITMKYSSAVLIFFMCMSTLFAQEDTAEKELRLRANENIRLIKSNPEEEFRNAIIIEAQAKELNVRDAELLALASQCIYYKGEIDFEKLMKAANTLFGKAKAYKMVNFQAIGKYYLFEAYLFNGLPEDAIAQLEEGMKYVNQAEKEGQSVISLKNNFYIAYSNYYLELGDYEKQLKYIKLTGDEIEKLPDGKQKEESKYLYYSNLAQIYNEMHEVDSAKHYSNLSKATDQGYNVVNAQFMNLVVLGEAAMKSGDYTNALAFFRNAEGIEGPKNHINVLNLYDNIIVAYRELQLPDSAKLYQYKKDSLRLNISENQNKLLHNLLEGISKKMYLRLVYGISAIILLVGIFIFLVVRKNRILKAQEDVSKEYLETHHSGADSHIKLIELVKENSPAFTTYFDEVYPTFSEGLLKINPKLSPSDLEFCALLKLKISTEDISNYRFIAPKTVQNKRYLIRKKLNIPKDVDSYHWFDNF